MPGADVGLQAEDSTIAELLKPMGYATEQFGKSHLTDQDKFLPTLHGFDAFFGNLYHLLTVQYTLCQTLELGRSPMEEIVTRLWDHLLDRLSGPLLFRMFIQPAVALYFGIRDGLRDARRGEPAYLWSIYSHPEQRRSLIEEGWKAMAKVFVVALIIDVIYQILVFRCVYPGEALLVAFLLAIVPYVLIRGPANRIARRL